MCSVALPCSNRSSSLRGFTEEFSSLLETDFVDVVFKVRGTPEPFAAHRCLVAAACKHLREDLRRIQSPPALSLRSSGLCWAGKKAQALSDDVACGEPSHEGVLDVSKEMWGDASNVKALLSFLYGRPTEVNERAAILLRETGKNLGFGELVESCEEALATLTAQALDDTASARPQQVPAAVKMDRLSSRSGTAEAVSGLVRSTSAERFLPRNLSGERKEGKENETSEIPRSVSGTEVSYAVQMKSNPATTQRSESNEGRNFIKRKASTSPHRPPEVHNVNQPPGNTTTDNGVVRRVLSEIRRSMAESSRIIADKTFQQIYELVPGTKGILGEGINGQVRRATERNTGREVAVKRISCVNLSEQRRQMLVSEVGIFLQVHHQNIVKLLEVYESEVDQAVLLVMELCTGKELFERLAERKWYSEYDAARVTRQMLDAVAYLHSQNICHRDLKLENWLYSSPKTEAKLKLCDFGFGQIVQPSVQLTATIGSLYYVAPEVLEGSYGIPCDMWSMGVIVYMLLSGKPPFDGKEDADVVAKIKQGRFICNDKRWEGISETAKHFVRSLLRKDPYERLSAAEAAQHAWLKMDQAAKASWPQGTPDAELELPINRCVVRDMWKFAQNNAITRAALGIFGKLQSSSAFGGREEDVTLLEQRFRSFDEHSSGKISAETFIKVLKESLPVQISSSEEKEFFDRIADVSLPADEETAAEDVSKHCDRWIREVNYKEFIMITKAQRRNITTAAIREVFRAFDENGDGYIKEDDAHSLLGQEFKDTISSYVTKLGKDVIDYRDFSKLVSMEIAKAEDHPHSEEAKADGPGAEAPETDSAEVLTQGLAEISTVSPVLTREVSPAAVKRIEPDVREGAPLTSERHGSHDTTEECDADAQSDEEQLVNVEETSENDPSRSQETESKEVIKCKEPPSAQRWTNSFSLSLAGSSEYDDSSSVNRVISRPSDIYYIKQLPGFHKKILRPFYAARPVSNVVMGLIRGTSLYARQSVVSKIATIIHTKCGSFFIMPNPKYHTEVDARKGLLSKDAGKFRFVAWWIHPGFVQTIKHWFQKLESEERRTLGSRLQGSGADEGLPGTAPASAPTGRGSSDLSGGSAGPTGEKGRDGGVNPGILNVDGNILNAPYEDPAALKSGEEFMGSPGDFRFSDVPKPENYLHTYRDLYTKDHVIMLQQLMEGTMRFLRSLFDESFIKNWELNAGFHYPVRTQYATLHMHVRVNSGPFCREDGRGMDAQKLMEILRADRTIFERDDHTMKYQVTENAKVCLLAAAQEYEAANDSPHPCHQISPNMFELGHHAMPTIHDDEEEDEEQGHTERSESPSLPDFPKLYPPHVFDANIQLSQLDDASNQYLVNLQPALGSAFYQILNKLRNKSREKYGPDPTHLYPLHVSVTGFFEACGSHLRQLVTGMTELLQQELAGDNAIEVREVVCTPTGYVLYDVHAPAISRFSQRLQSWAQQELGLCIRPKAGNHISLASNRPDEASRERIKKIFEPGGIVEEGLDIAGAIKTATFDLVFSRLLQRGSFETFDEEGPHRFMEVARMPVSSRNAA